MKLCIFDFDGTLFNSPVPNRNRLDKHLYGRLMGNRYEGGHGWSKDLITLSPMVTTDIGNGFNEAVVADAKKCIADPDTVTVLMTGRTELYRYRIEELCASAGLKFDEVLLKPLGGISTWDFKVRELDRLIKQYDSTTVMVWEDRIKHVNKFNDFLRNHPDIAEFEVIHVVGGDRILPQELEDKVITYLKEQHPIVESAIPVAEYYAVVYAVVLDAPSSERLKSQFIDHIPAGWKWIGHHMTIIHVSRYRSNQRVLHYAKTMNGAIAELEVVELGLSDTCMAVKVVTEVPSDNAIKHITLAVSPTGKAVQSNLIKIWRKLSSSFTLTGTIEAN